MNLQPTRLLRRWRDVGPRALALAAAVLAVWIQVTASPGLHVDLPAGGYRDFGSLWASGDAANRGLDPYDAYPLTYHVHTPMGELAAVNLNPPVSVLLFQPLARVDPQVGLRIWQGASTALYLLLVVWLARRFPGGDRWYRLLLVLAWQPLWSTLDLGQVYIALLLPTVCALLLLPRRPLLAGGCIGLLVALKPQFVLWPALLLVIGHRRPAVAALGGAALLSLLPVAVGHADWYARWATAVASSTPALSRVSGNLSAPGLLIQHGVPDRAALALAIVGLAALIAVVARRGFAAGRTSAIALVAAMLATPISWVGYAVVALPILLAQPAWSEAMTLAALGLAIPGPVLFWTAIPSFAVYESALGLMLMALLADHGPPRPGSANGWRAVGQRGTEGTRDVTTWG